MSNLAHTAKEAVEENQMKWGMQLSEIYRLSLKFYKDKSGKAVHLSYEDNLKLVALTLQASHGPINQQKLEPLGVFDVIGRDRRNQWTLLGDMTKLQSMEGFIDLLDRLCPSFKPYIEAIKQDREEKKRIEEVENAKKKELMEAQQKREEEQRLLENEIHREEIQRRKLQDALNEQTFYQFKEYAEKQFPGNPDQQAVLIKQLQTEHYHQYLQQLQSQLQNVDLDLDATLGESKLSESCSKEQETCLVEEKDRCESDNESDEFAVVQPANMWTRSDLKEFKLDVTKENGQGVIRVGHGDTVTIRVPTLEGGSSLFWEFATDSYDIGFGVYFEWKRPTTTEVTVHVSETDDELDENELGENDEDEEITCGTDDLECGTQIPLKPSSMLDRPPLSIIVPVYRRECHTDVYCGSHNYPGEGTYLLKFDNSFSLWRSKTVYYRIFYTR
ncbi:Golgi resident protein GCP60 [Chironomus tepperi]|uniref:Golgi resident protein GCP60 n=1 Tax=Chironomus tepperi TaxID=113505 RepID=UPI00391FC5EA